MIPRPNKQGILYEIMFSQNDFSDHFFVIYVPQLNKGLALSYPSAIIEFRA